MCPVSDVTSTGPTSKVLGLTALGDLLLGLVLAAIGVVLDVQVLSIVGLVLLLAGGGMLAFVIWLRNKPESL
jgi:hypothetical protein